MIATTSASAPGTASVTEKTDVKLEWQLDGSRYPRAEAPASAARSRSTGHR
jgi:hypothetical protein